MLAKRCPSLVQRHSLLDRRDDLVGLVRAFGLEIVPLGLSIAEYNKLFCFQSMILVSKAALTHLELRRMSP